MRAPQVQGRFDIEGVFATFKEGEAAVVNIRIKDLRHNSIYQPQHPLLILQNLSTLLLTLLALLGAGVPARPLRRGTPRDRVVLTLVAEEGAVVHLKNNLRFHTHGQDEHGHHKVTPYLLGLLRFLVPLLKLSYTELHLLEYLLEVEVVEGQGVVVRENAPVAKMTHQSDDFRESCPLNNLENLRHIPTRQLALQIMQTVLRRLLLTNLFFIDKGCDSSGFFGEGQEVADELLLVGGEVAQILLPPPHLHALNTLCHLLQHLLVLINNVRKVAPSHPQNQRPSDVLFNFDALEYFFYDKIVLLPHLELLPRHVRNSVLRKPLHKLAQVLGDLVDGDLEGSRDILNPRLFLQVLHWVPVLMVSQLF